MVSFGLSHGNAGDNSAHTGLRPSSDPFFLLEHGLTANALLPCSFLNAVPVHAVGWHERAQAQEASECGEFSDKRPGQARPSISQCPDLHGVCPLAGLGLS